MITRDEQQKILGILSRVDEVYEVFFASECFATINAVKTNGIGNVVAYFYAIKTKRMNISALMDIIDTDSIMSVSKVEIGKYTMRDALNACERLKFAERIAEGKWGREESRLFTR